MADRYWVGGSGTWTTTARWAATSGGAGGQSVPTANDDVYFDANSNTGTTAFTVTLAGTTICRNFSSNTDGRMTLAWGSTSNSLQCNGSWFNANTTFFAHSGTTTGTLSFLNNAAVPANGGNLNFNGLNPPTANITFNGVGASWTFQSALTLATTGRLTHTAGNVDLNGFTVSVGSYAATSSAQTRQLTFGSGRIVLNSSVTSTTIIDINGTSWSCDCSTSGLTGGFQRNTSNLAVRANIGTGLYYANGVSTSGFLPTANAPSVYINGGTGNIDFGQQSTVWNLDFTGWNGTNQPNNDFSGPYPDSWGICVGANLTLNANTSTSLNNFAFSFVSNTGIDHSFNTNRAVFAFVSDVGIAAESGNVTFIGNIRQNNADRITHTAGNLILNGYDQSIGAYYASTSASTPTTRPRRIDFGSANIYLLGIAANAQGIRIENASGWDCTSTGGSFVQASSSNEQYYTCGNTVALDINTANAPSLYTSIAGSPNINGYWNDLTFTGNRQTPRPANIYLTGNWVVGNIGNTLTNFSNVNIAFVGTKTQTANGTSSRTFNTMTVDKSPGSASNSITLVESATVVGNVLLNEGTLNLGNNTLTVPGAFNSQNVSDRSIIFGTGNIALTDTTAFDIVLDAWVYALTCSGTGGFTRNMSVQSELSLDGGTPPLSGNNLPNMTFTGVETITLKDPTQATSNFYAKNIAFSGTSTVVGGTGGSDNVNVYIGGNTTLNSGGTYSNVALKQIGTGTLITNGQSLQSYAIQCGTGVSGTATLGSALTTTTNIVLQGGTFTTANYSVTTSNFSVPGAQVAVLNMGTSTFTISGNSTQAWSVVDSASNVTINRGTSTISMTSGSSKTFTGGSKTYYNLNQAGGGILTIAGNNSFANITNSVQPTTVTFTAGTTQTVTNFGLSGTIGSPVTINSSSTGVQATLSKSSCIVNAQYLSIQYSNAIGGSVWNALYSTDNVNNTGWNIYAGGAVTSNMLLMFDFD